jgi:hypothetical protein
MTYAILAGLAARTTRTFTGHVVTGLFERAQAIAYCRVNQRGFILAEQEEAL